MSSEVIIVFIRLVRPVQEKNTTELDYHIFVKLLKVFTNLQYKALKIFDNGPNSFLNSTKKKKLSAQIEIYSNTHGFMRPYFFIYGLIHSRQ